MAKIVAEFDSNDKSLTVTKDGKKLSDVSHVMFQHHGKGEHSAQVHMSAHDNENDMHNTHTMHASKLDEVKKNGEATVAYFAKLAEKEQERLKAAKESQLARKKV